MFIIHNCFSQCSCGDYSLYLPLRSVEVGLGYLLKIGESVAPLIWIVNTSSMRSVWASLHLNWAPFIWNLWLSFTLCHVMWICTSGYNLGPIILHVVCKPVLLLWFMHLTNHNFQKLGGILRCWSYSKGITKIHNQNVSINYKADALCFILFFKTLMHKKENKGE